MQRSSNPKSEMNTRLPSRPRLNAPILLSPTSGKRGQALVEFTLVIPLLVLLLIGAIEIGRAAYYSIVVTNAARAAAGLAQNRAWAFNKDTVIQAALDDARMCPDPTCPSVLNYSDIQSSTPCECPDGFKPTLNECTVPNCCDSHGGIKIDYLEVHTEMQLTPLIGFPGLPTSFSLQGNAIMRIAPSS